MVGLKQRLLEQPADVAAADPVKHPAAVALALYQPREPQLGQVLTRDGRAAAGGPGQSGHVNAAVADGPEQPNPGGIGQEGERPDRRRDLLARRVLGMGSRRWAARVGGEMSDHDHTLATAADLHICADKMEFALTPPM